VHSIEHLDSSHTSVSRVFSSRLTYGSSLFFPTSFMQDMSTSTPSETDVSEAARELNAQKTTWNPFSTASDAGATLRARQKVMGTAKKRSSSKGRTTARGKTPTRSRSRVGTRSATKSRGRSSTAKKSMAARSRARTTKASAVRRRSTKSRSSSRSKRGR
jgi:hypothetical protein